MRRYCSMRFMSYFLFLVCFIWTLSIMKMSQKSQDIPEEGVLRNYVKGAMNNPKNSEDTKTILTVMKLVLDKLSVLEKRMDSLSVDKKIQDSGKEVQNTQSGSQFEQDENCKLDEGLLKAKYPHCKEKLKWMAVGWKTHPCYKDNGADGSTCSFVRYLSEHENWCPVLPGRTTQTLSKTDKSRKLAHVRTNLDGLMNILKEPANLNNYAWIKQRITYMWPRWIASITSLQQKQPLVNRIQKRILIHLGLLSHKAGGFKIGDLVNKGGPLGELVQWSDLLATLYILGQDMMVTSEDEQLQIFVNQHIKTKSPCASGNQLPLDMVYSDITGLKQFKRISGGAYGGFKCKLRVVDSFGTEPAFNHNLYSKANKLNTQWGKQDLLPQQFFTMFPHTPDNSFMGFVVEQPLRNLSRTIVRKNQALVYGKDPRFWKGKNQYLSIIHDKLDMHGTVYIDKGKNANLVPSFINNHGLLIPDELHRLLWESKVFVGLGFPYEGPAPLEAIASGCVFINPKFNPPHTSGNTAFFRGKPTLREVTSQHTYAEEHIGAPYVYTVNIQNMQEVKAALEKIMTEKVQPYLPYEFTEEGMLQRMNYYIEKQDFCSDSMYVPDSSISVLLADKRTSCKDYCKSRGLVCEPSHFTKINDISVINSLFKYPERCKKTEHMGNIQYPGYNMDSGTCILQQDRLLFSCVGSDRNVRRICPCRTFEKGQMAICEGCV